MRYDFELHFVDGQKIRTRVKTFQAANDIEAKKKGVNKWTGAGNARRSAKLLKFDLGKPEVIASWNAVSH